MGGATTLWTTKRSHENFWFLNVLHEQQLRKLPHDLTGQLTRQTLQLMRATNMSKACYTAKASLHATSEELITVLSLLCNNNGQY